MAFLKELQRRKVYHAAVAYIVTGWLLLQLADTLIGLLSLPPWTGKLVVAIVLLGFPLTLVLAWIYDWTPKGVVVTDDVDAEAVVGNERVADGLTALDSAATKSVAVLPFANLSPLEENAFFADGIHDELLTHLAKLSAFQVMSRTSVMQYRDTVKSIPEIATELGATVVLEGSVQRAGDRVRINMQLIDGANDSHLWAEIFDRELTLDNLFEIQAEVSRLIANALHAVLSGDDEEELSKGASTENLKAYDAYLHGQLLARSEAAGEKEFRESIAWFDKAIEADPEFAEPHAGKARALLTLYWFFGWDYNWIPEAKKSVAQAVAMAPDTTATLLAQAYYHYWAELDYDAALKPLNQLLKKMPNNAEAWACKAYVIRRMGRFSESTDALRNAIRLDPMLVDLQMELATTLVSLGRLEETDKVFDHVLTLDADSAFTAYYAGDIGYVRGDAEASWQGASHPVDEMDFVYCYRRAFHALNTRDPEKIESAFAKWPDNFKRTPAFPVTFEVYRAMAYIDAGKEKELQETLDEIARILQKTPHEREHDWRPDAPYFPVTIPGLHRDLEAVHEQIEYFTANAPKDEFGKLNHYPAIAAALVRAGDHEGALDYLEQLINLFGPNAYLGMSITPAYDPLHNHPRYQAFKESAAKAGFIDA